MLLFLVRRRWRRCADGGDSRINQREDDKFNRGEANNFNIRKNFLENSMAAIRDMTMKQFNILIVTNQNRDEIKTPLKG